jgi:hypothetical protein
MPSTMTHGHGDSHSNEVQLIQLYDFQIRVVRVQTPCQGRPVPGLPCSVVRGSQTTGC